jgi:biopolymer transport protein ExbD
MMNSFRMTQPDRQRRGPDLTPVMDVVFILVVFFLVVSTFSETLVKPMQVSLPGASAASSSAQRAAELNLSARGMTLDGEAVTAVELASRLSALADRPLIIVADDDAPYQALLDALDGAQAAGLGNVKVETERGLAK